MISYRNTAPAVVLICACVLVGCQASRFAPSATAVETVRNGVLAAYNSTTVGKAFDGTFRDGKWTSLESAKGVTIVQFDGTVMSSDIKAAGMNDAYLCDSPEACRVPVMFQFTMAIDKKAFALSYYDEKVFKSNTLNPGDHNGFRPVSQDNVMAFIYR